MTSFDRKENCEDVRRTWALTNKLWPPKKEWQYCEAHLSLEALSRGRKEATQTVHGSAKYDNVLHTKMQTQYHRFIMTFGRDFSIEHHIRNGSLLIG